MLASWNDGLKIYDLHSGAVSHYIHNENNPNGLRHNNVSRVFQDSKSRIWTSTDNGLSVLQPHTNQFIHFYHDFDDPHKLPSSAVYGIIEDKLNNIWIATARGLVIYNETHDYFKRIPELLEQRIYMIFMDSNQQLWLSTSSGLVHYKPDKNSLFTYNKKNGLSNNNIYGILEDHNNNIWVSTNYGLNRLNRKTATWQHYFKTDGLQGNELLELSRLQQQSIDQQQTAKNDQWVDIEPLLSGITQAFNDLLHKKSITLKVENQLHLWVKLSYDHLEKIIINLLSNAIKYTLPGGDIQIKTQWHAADKLLCLQISDTGIGIPEDQQQHIFERFVRLTHLETEQIPGAGIGLAMVKELVDEAEGKIELQSSPEKGSIFTVYLTTCMNKPENIRASQSPYTLSENSSHPLAEADTIALEVMNITTQIQTHQPTKQHIQPIKAINNLIHILIIEDNPDMRQHLTHHLNELYDYSEACNGAEGVNMAQAQLPDLIICDVMMPEMNGYEVCRHLKDDEKTCHIPIILLTALNDRTHKLQGLKEKADEYLTKPFDMEELTIRIENLLHVREQLKQRFSIKEFTASAPPETDTEDTTLNIPFIACTETLNPRETAFIQRFEKVLIEHYHDPQLNVEKMAECMFLTRRQLHRKTTALLGRSSTHLLKSFRMLKAQNLLKDGISINETAYQIGFTNPNYFSTTFKTFVGITASEFQNRFIRVSKSS